MGRYEELNEELARLRESIRQAERAQAQCRDLREQRQDGRRRKEALAEQLAKEEADVAALEHMSLTALVQTVLGRREERLEQEQREAVAARLNYQESCRSLEDVEGRLHQAEAVQAAAGADRDKYEALLEEKTQLLKAEAPALAQRLVPLEEQIGQGRAMLRELDEARQAGRAALEALDRAVDELDDAEGWGTWDMLGGGLLSTMAKHEHIDGARDAAAEAQMLLNRFRTELADVRLHTDLTIDISGTATFCDYFFDGLLADWVVQSGIHDAQENVGRTRDQAAEVLAKLDQMDLQTRAALAQAEQERKELVEKA